MGYSIRRYGALWVTCSGRFEQFHKQLKLHYRGTSKKTKQYMSEMIAGLRSARAVAAAMLMTKEPAPDTSSRQHAMPPPGESAMVGRPCVVNMNLTTAESHQPSSLPFDEGLYSEVRQY